MMDKCELCIHRKVCKVRPPEQYPKEFIFRIQSSCTDYEPMMPKKCVDYYECCPHCGRENWLGWDYKDDGYEIFCMYCGEKMMLCNMCPESDSCDWRSDDDGNGHCKMRSEKNG